MKRILLAISLLFFAAPAFAQVASVTLDWTAVGDDGTTGTAASHEMRWKSSAPSDTTQAAILTWWNTATVVTNMPAVLASGSAQTVVVSPSGGFQPGVYFFVLRVCDEVPNCSAFSNIAQKSVLDALPPARITDLRVR